MSRAPWTLKLHALLVLGAALLAPDHDAGFWWTPAVLVALGAWWVLWGSRFAWWVQAVAVAAGLYSVWNVWWSLAAGESALYVFVPPATLLAVTALLVVAAVLLLVPPSRAYCADRTDGPRSAAGLALGALFMGTFPATGLSLDSRLPSKGSAEWTPNLVFVGAVEGERVALYVGGAADERCLVMLAPRSSSRSCHHGRHSHSVNWERSDRVAAGLVPLDTARVDVVYLSGETRPATLLSHDAARANVYYFDHAVDDAVGIRAFDAAGNKIARYPSGPPLRLRMDDM
ncbi:MAG: hypothetical protein M3134_08255 [Actinomycetota bacterium]|nr:hypothetical protein [Actinomycetota bacterium]